jgi:hypothetical protein
MRSSVRYRVCIKYATQLSRKISLFNYIVEEKYYMDNEKSILERAAVEKLFAERKDFIIIGLTGRTSDELIADDSLLPKLFL